MKIFTVKLTLSRQEKQYRIFAENELKAINMAYHNERGDYDISKFSINSEPEEIKPMIFQIYIKDLEKETIDKSRMW